MNTPYEPPPDYPVRPRAYRTAEAVVIAAEVNGAPVRWSLSMEAAKRLSGELRLSLMRVNAIKAPAGPR